MGIFLSECKSTHSATTSTAISTTQPAVETPPPADVKPAPVANDLIANGRNVFQTKCVDCHELPKPASYGKDEWADIMIKMSRKAHLSDVEANQVLAFVNEYAKP